MYPKEKNGKKLPQMENIVEFDGNIFGKRLHNLRRDMGIAQYQLAEAIEVTNKTICVYEAGAKPTVDNLTKLASALNTSPNYLLGWDEDKGGLSDDDISNK